MSNDPVNNYTVIPDVQTGYILNNQKGFWSLVVPDYGENLINNSSFEYSPSSGMWTFTNLSGAQSAEWSAYDLYSYKFTPVDDGTGHFTAVMPIKAVYNLIPNLTVGQPYCLSFYFKGGAGDSFKATVNVIADNAVYGTTYFNATGGIDRVVVPFVPGFTGVMLKLEKLSNSVAAFYIDAMLLEANPTASPYFDGGLPNCYYYADPSNSKSIRTGQGAGGQEIDLHSLGFEIYTWSGAGVVDPNNITAPVALTGSSTYQRTTAGSRTISLIGALQGTNFADLQRKRRDLEKYLVPDADRTAARPLLLKFQPVSGLNTTGNALYIPVFYAGGLSGVTDNLYQEKITLQFLEIAPPSIYDPAPNSVILSTTYTSPTLTATGSLIYNDNVNGWQYADLPGPTNMLHIARNGDIYAAEGPVAGQTGLNQYRLYRNFLQTSAPKVYANGTFNAVAVNTNGDIYVGGNFTSISEKATSFSTVTRNYIFKSAVSTGTNNSDMAASTAMPVGITGNIRTMCFGADGNLYIGTDVAYSGSKLVKYDPTANSYSPVGAVTAQVNQIIRGDGYNMYVATASGVFSMTVYFGTPSLGSAALGSFTSSVPTIAWGNDGYLYAGGSWSTISGATVNNVARWNGAQWQALDTGFNAAVMQIAYNPVESKLYAVGSFTKSGDGFTLLQNIAVWNGSSWLPVDMKTSINGATCYALAAGRPAKFGANVILFGYQAWSGNGFLSSAKTSISYTGTAPVNPVIKVAATTSGGGRIVMIKNAATGRTIYTNYYLQTGEIVTFDFSQQPVAITSSVNGSIMSSIIKGSNISNFDLIPGQNGKAGANDIYIFVDATGATGRAQYNNKYWSIDNAAV